MKYLPLFFILVFDIAWCQSIGDYQSRQSGNWNAVASWETWDGDEWMQATSFPNSLSNTITIRNEHTITIVSSVVTGHSLVVEGNLILSGGIPTLHHVRIEPVGELTGDSDVTILGNILNEGTFQLSDGTIAFADSTLLTGGGTNMFFTMRIDSGAYLGSSSAFLSRDALTINGRLDAQGGFVAGENLTVSGTGSLNVTGFPFSVTATLRVNSPGTLTTSADATFHGNMSVTGSFASTASVSLPDTTTLTGTGLKSFHNIVISGWLVPNGNYSITGNITLSGSGTLSPGNRTTTFSGITEVRNMGEGRLGFNNITIALNTPSYSVTIHEDVTIQGATQRWNNGSFSSLTKVTFARQGTTRITGTGAVDFQDVRITQGTTFTPNTPYTIKGDLFIEGTLTSGNSTATIDGQTLLHSTVATIASFNNLVINPGKSLQLWTGNTGINGNFVNNGSFNPNGGTIIFGGSAAKTISGSSHTTFNNITLNNGTALTDLSLVADAGLTGVLRLAANARFDTDGPLDTAEFTLFSTGDDPVQDASIAPLPTGALVTGKVTVERHMSLEGPLGRIYRYISSPVENASVLDFQQEIPVTGNFSGQSTCTGCASNPSLFWYDETLITGGINSGYTQFPQTNNGETFLKGRGYASFIRGNVDPVSTEGNAKFDLRGIPNMGAINFPVTYSSSGVPADDGWNLVGNPYPCAIDWNAAAGWTRQNIGSTIYIPDNGQNPTTFATWNGTVGTNGGSPIIAMGQGFFIQATGSSPLMTSDEGVKVTGLQAVYFRKSSPTNVLRVNLSSKEGEDEAVIHFVSGASKGFDFNRDAIKLKNFKAGSSATPFLNISTQSYIGERLAINSLPPMDSAEVYIDVTDVPAGHYRLEISGVSTFSETASIFLYDHFLTSLINVRKQSVYDFETSAEPGSYGLERFRFMFYDIQSSVTAVRESELAVYPNPFTDFFFIPLDSLTQELTIEMRDMLGRKIEVISIVKSDEKLRVDMANHPPGIYFLTITTRYSRLIYRLIKT